MTWSMQWAGLTIGGNSPYQLVSVTGVHDSPDVRTADADRARASGQWAGTDLLSGRAITATVEVVASDEVTVGAFTNAMTVANGPERPLSLQFPGVAGGALVTVEARVRRFSLPLNRPYLFGHGTAVVEWWATDPRIYAQTPTVVSTDVGGSSGAGMEFDAEFDLEFGGATPSGVVNVNNDGTFPAPWILEVAGTVSNLRIENVTTGQSLRFTGTPAAGETLVVDSYSRQVTIGGVSRYSWLDPGSRWFDLQPGATQIRVASSSGSGVGELTFRSAWI